MIVVVVYFFLLCRSPANCRDRLLNGLPLSLLLIIIGILFRILFIVFLCPINCHHPTSLRACFSSLYCNFSSLYSIWTIFFKKIIFSFQYFDIYKLYSYLNTYNYFSIFQNLLYFLFQIFINFLMCSRRSLFSIVFIFIPNLVIYKPQLNSYFYFSNF